MPEIENVLDELDTFGKPEGYLKPKEDPRLDGRSKKEFIDKVESSNKEEDHHVAHISQLHNAAELGLIVSTAGLGKREGFVSNLADIRNEGDHRWFFHPAHLTEVDPFVVNVELKSRKGPGSDFRPKEMDVRNFIERNIPYLLIQNAETPEASIILFRMEDLIYVRDSYGIITHELKYGKPWNPYQKDKSKPVETWKEYYKCNVFDCADRFANRKISYHDLKQNGSYDMWMNVVKYFCSVSGKQN